MPDFWLFGNLFFVFTIFIIVLYEYRAQVAYNRRLASFYYYYDDTKSPEAEGEKEKLDKLGIFLGAVELFSNFLFVLGIGCAIMFVALN